MGRHGITRRFAVAAFAASVLTGALTGCGSSNGAQSADGSTKVTIAIGSPALSAGTANVAAVPQKLGYYRKAGLDVTIQPSQGATESMQLLSAGKADFVVGGSSSFYQVALTDPDVRVVSLQSENTWKIEVPAGSPIKSIGDLKGKTVGVQALASGTYQFGQAAVAASGVNPKDITWLPVGLANQTADAFANNRIVAYSTYFGQEGAIERALGKSLVSLPTPLDQVHGLAGVATTKDMLENHRDVVVKVLTAMYQGGVFAQTNPGAALQIHWQGSPAQKPAGKSTEDAVKAALPDVADRYKSFVGAAADGQIGVLPAAEVTKSIDFLARYGIIKRPVDSKIVDLSPSADANKFDRAAVEQQAKSWKP